MKDLFYIKSPKPQQREMQPLMLDMLEELRNQNRPACYAWLM